MKKKIIMIFLVLFISIINISVINAKNFKCKIDSYDVEYNSSGNIVAVYKDGVKDSTYNNVKYYSEFKPRSESECPSVGYKIYASPESSPGSGYFEVRKDYSCKSATNCAGFTTKECCQAGITVNNGNYGCAWNEEYEFCSPNGLTYLACGSGKTAANDIPEIIPRLVSYFIVILKTVTPIVLIIMGMVQIIKAIAMTNDDEIKKAKSALIKKMIAAVLIFFSISIVQFVVDQVVDEKEKGSLGNCLKCFINNDCGDSQYFVDGYGNCYGAKTKAKIASKYCNTDIGIQENKVTENTDNSGGSSSSSSGSASHGSSGPF